MVDVTTPLHASQGAQVFALHLRPAHPGDASTAALLIYMTMERVANYLLGSKEAALPALAHLFACPGTRFSYEFAQVAEVGGGVVGMILAAPFERLSATAGPTARALLRALGLRRMAAFVWRSLDVRGVPEGERGEYYIAHLAVLPEYRSRGIGSLLLAWAEEQAKSLGRDTVSLVVEIGHERARAFYERHGYQVTAIHETPRLHRRFGYRGVYRMVKTAVSG